MSGKTQVTLSVDISGPIADGTASDAIHEWMDETKKQAADFAVRQLKAVEMDKTGRATGHYQEQIRTTLLTYNDVLVNDPVVYGPWLEGTSKRNRSTRFKGYRLWRQAKQATQDQIGQIAEDLWPKYADRIGGGE